MKTLIGLFVACLMIAGCAGGGGGSTVAVPNAPTGPTGSSPQYASLQLSFPVRSSGSSSRPQYVSPSTSQIEVVVNTVNGGAPPSWVPADVTTPLTTTGGSPNCSISAGTETCNLQVAAPPGTVNYTFTVKDTGGAALGTLTTDETVVQGVANAFNVTLQGIVKTVTVSGTALAANDQSFATTGETLTVQAQDADGNQIVLPGAYNNAVTLTDNDATGQTKLSLNGGAASSSVISTSPADVVKLVYTGQAANSFAIAASGTGITGGGTISTTVNDVTFSSGTTLDTAPNGGINTDPNWGQQTVFFSTDSGTQNVTAAETGFTNAPFSKLFDIALSGGCAGVASASAGPATTYTITALGHGVCSARLTEHGTGYPITGHAANVSGSATHDGTFWISVTTSSFTVGKSR